jgi:hypothetical protein
MGWRPGPPPIGYFNRSFAGIKDIVVDPDRKDTVIEMFYRVGNGKESGRKIKLWLDSIGFTTRAGKQGSLSTIFTMLTNPFYYGKFEYPTKSGTWYQGKHKPLITKELFDKVQRQLVTCPKSKWGGKTITFKGLFKCGKCKENMIGEDRMRKVKVGPARQHIYYHCARKMGVCDEPYISEEKLIGELVKYIGFMENVHPGHLTVSDLIFESIEKFKSMREEILYHQNINPKTAPLDMKEYAKYTLRYGLIEEKRNLVKALGKQLFIRDQVISTSSEPYSWSFQGKKLRNKI